MTTSDQVEVPQPPIIGAAYKHYRGEVYTVIGIAESMEDGSIHVVFKSASNKDRWLSTPMGLFIDKVTVDEMVTEASGRQTKSTYTINRFLLVQRPHQERGGDLDR